MWKCKELIGRNSTNLVEEFNDWSKGKYMHAVAISTSVGGKPSLLCFYEDEKERHPGIDFTKNPPAAQPTIPKPKRGRPKKVKEATNG